MKVIAVERCPCKYESEFVVVSVHRSPRGAAKAMNALKSRRHADATTGVEIQAQGLYMVSLRRAPGRDALDLYRYRSMEVQA